MWIMISDAFLSIVDKDCPRDCLLIRARRRGDIERVFGKLAIPMVTHTPKADYAYRAVIAREVVKAAMAREIDRVTYSNFKSSVEDEQLHDAYLSVWSIMHALQSVLMIAARRGRRARR